MQIGDKNGQRKQVDVAGGLGPTWPHRPATQGHRLPPQVALPHHRSVGAATQALSCVDLSRFQPMVMMERPWIHGPIVIDLELHQLTYRLSFIMCCFYNCHWEPTIAIGL